VIDAQQVQDRRVQVVARLLPFLTETQNAKTTRFYSAEISALNSGTGVFENPGIWPGFQKRPLAHFHRVF